MSSELTGERLVHEPAVEGVGKYASGSDTAATPVEVLAGTDPPPLRPPTMPSEGAEIELPELRMTALELEELTMTPQLLLILALLLSSSAPLDEGLSE